MSEEPQPDNVHIARKVAVALAAALSGATWKTLGNTSIAATMRRKPDYGLEDLGSLVVSVVPLSVAFVTETRQLEMAEVGVGVVVAKHVGTEAEIAQLEDFEQEIINEIRAGRIALTTLPDGSDWSELANPVPFDPETLETRNVFLGQVVVTYKIPIDRI